MGAGGVVILYIKLQDKNLVLWHDRVLVNIMAPNCKTA